MSTQVAAVSYFDLKKSTRVDRSNVALTRDTGPKPLGLEGNGTSHWQPLGCHHRTTALLLAYEDHQRWLFAADCGGA